MSIENLTQTYVIGDNSGDFIEHACEACAEEFATKNSLEWNWNRNFTEDNSNGLYAYNALWDSGEADYPVACNCGQYLDVSLTKEGRDYMLERGDFPAWLYEAHNLPIPVR